MDFELSEEQQLLKQTCDRYFADHYQFESRKRYAHEPRGWSLIAWKQYADLGLLGVPFAEEHGGTGGGPVETMIVMEQIGRVLLLEPYLATVVLGGGFLQRGGSDAQRAELLPKIAAGELSLSFAHAERQARYDLANVATTARRDGGAYVLDGAKKLVLHGDTAEKFVVSARVSGDGPTATAWRCFDRCRRPACPCAAIRRSTAYAAEVTLSNARVGAGAALGEPAPPSDDQRVADRAIAAVRRSGQRHGGHARDHRRVRENAQAIRRHHRRLPGAAASRRRDADRRRASAQHGHAGGGMAAEDDARGRRQTISAAKVQIGRSGRFVGQQPSRSIAASA
jgi:alkylation response protein AidB-like acyl-CoA dehydrogenase